VEEISQSSRKIEENINETIPDIGSNNIPSNIYQPLKPISEKFRIFEASYEKVFGKGIQNIPSPTSKDVEQNIENNLEDKTVQKINEKEKTTFEPVSTLKDQSEEKKDLFKAIFLSSSEDSDSETEDNIDSEAVKSILIGKDPKEINVQRNTSPPRGIFAKLDLDSLVTQPKHVNNESTSKISEISLPIDDSQNDLTNRNDVTDDVEIAVLPDMYGPVLPQRLLKQDNTTTTEADNTNQLKPIFRSVVVSKTTEDSKLGGKWVERDKVKKSKKKHKHKEHKEHKSPKHKKKSKKEKRSKR